MNPTKIAKIYEFSNENDFVYIFNNRDRIQTLNLSDAERKHLQDKTIEDESQWVHFYVNGCHQFYVFVTKRRRIKRRQRGFPENGGVLRCRSLFA